MEKKVLTEEEVSNLKALKQQFKDLTDVVGQIEIQKLSFYCFNY